MDIEKLIANLGEAEVLTQLQRYYKFESLVPVQLEDAQDNFVEALDTYLDGVIDGQN